MDSPRPLSLLPSFGIAALLIVVGVTSTWIVLKRSGEQASQVFPEISRFQFDTSPTATELVVSWVQSGEDAYSAGRIVEPQADNALYYFHKALRESPELPEALDGLDRVSHYLRSSVENAINRTDWAAANRYVEMLQSNWPADDRVQRLANRVARLQQLEVLTTLVDRQDDAARLTEPQGDNALATYQQIPAIEPDTPGLSDAEELLESKRLVVDELRNGASSDTTAGRRAAAEENLDRAASAGAPAAEVARPRGQLTYQQTPARAHNVRFGELQKLSTLDVSRRTVPKYPRDAIGGGWVQLAFTVSETGDVVDAEVVKSSDVMFDAAALYAIHRWNFVPTLVRGVPVPVRSGIRFTFEDN